MNIIKRDGKEAIFNVDKIRIAIQKANKSVPEDLRLTDEKIEAVVQKVLAYAEKFERALDVEEVQDRVEKELMMLKTAASCAVAKSYIVFRYQKTIARKKNTTDGKLLALVDRTNEDVKQENSNKNPTLLSTQRDYIAGEVSRDITNRLLLPADISKAHRDGSIHFHDADYHIHRGMFNCCLVNLEDMFKNGTVISGIKIFTPKSFITACTVATQISAQIASNQYGGQTMSLAHLAPYIDVSRRKISKQMADEFKKNGIEVSKDKFNSIVEDHVKLEIKQGVQTINHQLSTISCVNGQAPFITLFMYLDEVEDGRTKDDLAMLIEEVLRQRIQGMPNEDGVCITPAFPKLIYVLEEDNVEKDSKYFYLTKIAAECTAKRLVPDFISKKKMLEYKIDKSGTGRVYCCMGCRSFLTPYLDEDGKPKYYGRFNQGVVTINLPYVGLEAKKNMDTFWKLLDERLELCHRALQLRHERLVGTPSDVSPLHWQNGALARLKKGETIDKLLYGGYSTISLGYAGLWECVYSLIGKKLTEPEGEKLGLEIMQKLNDATAKWKAAENMDYSIYGTPLESTTYKFAKCLQKKFGNVEGVSDRNYITNSYHVHVTEHVNAFDKLALEAKFQRLSPGGAISYVECPNMLHNIEAVITVMKFIYDNIMYAELNSKSDHCSVCGSNEELECVEDENGKLIWRCRVCGNTDTTRMSCARRTCGYIGSAWWSQGRTWEIHDRVLHL